MVLDNDRDPERDRIADLIDRVREGNASDAEVEELSLYARDRRDVAISMTRAEADRQLGRGWLARAEVDKQIEAAEKTPFVLAERAVGSTLAVVGIIGGLFVPALGIAAVAGLGILGLSALRVHIMTAHKDPYREIEK